MRINTHSFPLLGEDKDGNPIGDQGIGAKRIVTNGFLQLVQRYYKKACHRTKTQTYVQHGPLAGATVTITITDAKPDNYRGSLNTFHEYKDGDGWDDTSAYNKGQHNSLRLCL